MTLRRILTLFALLLAVGPVAPVPAADQVKLWEEDVVIPTYRIGEPNLNPIFYSGKRYQGASGEIYPYPLMDTLTDIRENQPWKTVFLENQYVKMSVLPENGGRIFSAMDKSNGYDLFYRQTAIKPALISVLGAWISGGIEWNVPHHHRTSTYLHCDYYLEEHPDGSKTVWVGEIERRHRVKWMIGLTLYPDRSYIEAHTKFFNRTPLALSFLCWANVAVHAHPSYQIIFPPSTDYATYHGKNQFSDWPISHSLFNRIDYTAGVDVSWWKNHPAPISWFCWESQEDFLAGYNHDREAGVVHVANHHLVPGKKLFEWGNGPQQVMWDKMLTENGGPYIELMVGAYSDNQPDYSWCQPYEVKDVRQYWYPIRELKGVKNANLEGCVNLEVTDGDSVLFGFNTTTVRDGARAVLSAGERILFDRKIDISPEKPFVQETALPSGVKEADLKAALYSADGLELVAYSPVKKKGEPMPEPVKPPGPPEEIGTIEGLYMAGLWLEQLHNPIMEPYPYYEEALRRDPGDYRVNTALAALYCKRGMFREAEEHLNRAVERATYNYIMPKDGEAFYYLGVALRGQGRDDEAFDNFFKAAWSSAWYSPAFYSLAELACRKGDYRNALEYVDRSISTNTLNTSAANLKSAVLRKLKRFDEARQLAAGVQAADRLDYWSGNELYLIDSAVGGSDRAAADLKTLTTLMRGEPQSYLELAVDYGNCGFYDEAIDVLARLADSKQPGAGYPMLHYYLAYYLEKKGDGAAAMKRYQAAAGMSPDYCFPYRLESIDVLQRAQAVNPKDARAPYYLGNLLYDRQPERAVAEWEKSRKLDGSFAIVHRNLGLAYASVENDVPKAIAALEEALRCDKNDPRLYYELDKLYEAGGTPVKKRLALLDRNFKTVEKRDDSLSQLIALYVLDGQYDKAIDLIDRHHFHKWEGGGELRDVFVDAHILRGQKNLKGKRYDRALNDFRKTLEYPDNQEIGKPDNDLDEIKSSYYIGLACEAMGQADKARESFQRAADGMTGVSEYAFYKAMSLKKLGRNQEADGIFDQLIADGTASLNTGAAPEYFAKFGERQSRTMRDAGAHYLIGLGLMGKDKRKEATVELNKVLELNAAHIPVRKQLAELD